MHKKRSKEKNPLLLEIEQLRIRLKEAEETLQAIRSGEADALVITGPLGEQVYTLQGADQSYRILFETMEEGAATLGAGGTVLYCNRRLAEMLRAPLEKVIGSSMQQYLSPEDWPAFLFMEKGRGGRKRDFELRTADGGMIPAIVSLGCLEAEVLQGTCMTVTDLTEQKRVERELQKAREELEIKVRERTAELAESNRALNLENGQRRHSEEALQAALTVAEEGRKTLEALMEYVPEGITIADAAEGKILMVSRRGEEILGGGHEGWTLEETANQWAVYHPDGKRRMGVEDLPLIRAMRRGEMIRNAEIIQENAAGERLSLLCNAAPIRDREGNITGGIAAWRDVTDVRRMQNALLESERRYRNLFERMNEGFALHQILCDEEGRPFDYRFLEVNPAFEKQTGMKGADIVGRTVREVMPGIEPIWIDRYGRVALKGKPDNFEEWSKTLGRWFDVSAFQNEEGHFATIFLDITQRKHAEERIRRLNEDLIGKARDLERANKELDSFASMVSHDIKNELVVIGALIRRLFERQGQNLDAKGREYLRMINESADNMAHFVDDLLELSRVSKSRIKLERMDLGNLAGAIIKKFREKDEERQVEVVIQKRMEAVGDRRLLGVALENLLGNAWKFSKNASPARIEMGQSPAVKGPVFYIRDNGCGFDCSANRDRVFLPFQRFHSAGEYPGTGVGLCTVRRILECHGGRIWCESEIGKGATFYFSIGEFSGKEKSDKGTGIQAKRKILLGEDEQFLQRIYQEELGEAGYEVRVAGSGRQVLKMIAEEKFDLVILDIKMPVLDGLETLTRLRNENHNLPVLIHTSHGEFQDDPRSLLAQGFIRKTIDLGELKGKIHELLRSPSKGR
jgi:PAS domain S-box-containing protein